ncbi:hypothetical protein PR202_gb07882 [Eleusine coracana subsp. coracana]|uniref:Acetyltransferase n=1 Tax=Eleusine coracana subsp. coracana TaxID=191504 RepID=A0AAV5EDA1_ELECO|nr:hypothetical protein PR202_gb07882 [Eleusine coracana subsp. coracana]
MPSAAVVHVISRRMRPSSPMTASGAHLHPYMQVMELVDGVFIGMSLNHSVSNGAAFWHFFNGSGKSALRGS